MTAPEKQQIGDGNDNLVGAAQQAAKAAKQALDTANSTAAAVKAGAESGKAVAEIAAGTAAGGPWGALLSAAWSMRHALFKILVCLCLLLLVFIILIVSLPTVVTNGVLGLDGVGFDPNQPLTLEQAFNQLSGTLTAEVRAGYEKSLSNVDKIIKDGDYDRDFTMAALINHAQKSSGYDVSYIFAAYSASMHQQNTSEKDMVNKLQKVADELFPVTYVEKEKEKTIPLEYTTYKLSNVTVVTAVKWEGFHYGLPTYSYTTENRTYYEPNGTVFTDTQIKTTDYAAVAVKVPMYIGDTIIGTMYKTYYERRGEITLTPDKEMVKYAECTIHPFDTNVIAKAFGIDMDASYDQFNTTYREAIQRMADSLKMTLYGALDNGETVPLTDEELQEHLDEQSCSEVRKNILKTALSLVGKVPYFWGGKSAAGWNDEWNTPKLVTATGSSSTGTIRPYGMDCSGFTDWVYKTAVGQSLGVGSWNQWDNSIPITEDELLPGDLGFLGAPGTVPTNHVLIYAGKSKWGKKKWVHCTSGSGVVMNSPKYITEYRRPANVNFN